MPLVTATGHRFNRLSLPFTLALLLHTIFISCDFVLSFRIIAILFLPHKKVCMMLLVFVNCRHLYFTRVALGYQYNIGISQHFLLHDTYRLSRYAFDVPISYKPTDSRTVRQVSRQHLAYIPGPTRAQIALL